MVTTGFYKVKLGACVWNFTSTCLFAFIVSCLPTMISCTAHRRHVALCASENVATSSDGRQ